MTHQISHRWRTVLEKLAKFYDTGIDRADFCILLGDNPHSINNLADAALQQMWHTRDIRYWEYVPGGRGRIRITDQGREALRNDN